MWRLLARSARAADVSACGWLGAAKGAVFQLEKEGVAMIANAVPNPSQYALEFGL